MPQRKLAVELLQKLLKGEIRGRGKRNVVQARSFAELLEQAVRKYQNRAIDTAQVQVRPVFRRVVQPRPRNSRRLASSVAIRYSAVMPSTAASTFSGSGVKSNSV